MRAFHNGDQMNSSVMRWCVLVAAVAVVASAVSSPRRCSGRIARERLKAAEKVRDKRYYLLCCAPACAQPRRRPPTAIRRYQPFHKTWYGLKYGCNCSKLGSESNACDIRTGQCRCKPHVTGRACDTCEEGYWGLQLGACRRCSCGAGAAACDPHSGLCACAPGVGGAHCDACLPGFYGFGPNGCLPCPACSDGKVCSAASGRCVCPRRSRGPHCQHCAAGYTRGPGGCQPCRCGAGALSNECDEQTGQCRCRSGWTGAACDRCGPAHFGERCRPCRCHPAGTRVCGSGPCPCDQHGRCPCKENVVGEKCDTCLEGTFGLSEDNASGCTACFCFGRATHCTQASLTRAALHAAAPHHVTLLRASRNYSVDENSLIAISMDKPDATIAVPDPPVPIYIELDKRFLGDRVTSYGGALRFTVEEEGGEPLPPQTMAAFPLVRLEGNDITLNHYQRVPAMNGSYAIRFHESLWEVRGHGAVATRPVLMATLQRLTRVLLRASSRAPGPDRVHALVLNVSMDSVRSGSSRSAAAEGVELCRCGAGYAAPSCQDPAPGFWVPRPTVSLASAGGTVVITLHGHAKPCLCNGRADTCHPDTGACLNCTGGTGGPHCQECAEGYYGSPDTGCQSCPCPSRAANYARSCAITNGRLHCLCKPGYSGSECERCAPGWYRRDGSACQPCGCHPGGSLSPVCDGAGRCQCGPRAAGHKCDRCVAARAAMDHRGECTVCDNCTQTLLDSVEQLTTNLHAHVNTDELSRIPKPFPALLEFAYNASMLQSALSDLRRDTQQTNLSPSIQELEEREHKLFTEANTLKTVLTSREEQAHYLSLESMSDLEEVLKQRRKIGEQVAALDEFARGERHLSAHRAVKEAKQLLRHIKDITLNDYLSGANDIFDTANVQSTSVQEYNYRIEDILRRVQSLRSGVDRWERKSEELQRLADRVWAAGDLVDSNGVALRPRLAALGRISAACSLLPQDIASLSVSNLTDDVGAAILRSQTLAIKFPDLVSELHTLSRAAEEKEGILYNLTPIYKEKYLQAVEKHVQKLNEKAKEYKTVFAGARSAASLGVSAAHAWGAVAGAVADAAAAAGAARQAAAAAHAAFSKDLVPRATAAGVNASNDLKKRGADLLTRSEELQSRLEALRRAGDVVSVSLRALGWAERALGAAPRARVRDVLGAAGARADRVFAAARALYDEAADLTRRARYTLRRRLALLQQHGDTQLGAAQEHVSQIRGNTLRGAELAEALAAAAAARAREHAAAARALRPALRLLRARAAAALDAAGAIDVSVSSAEGGVGCRRGYWVSGAPPAATRLTTAVSFTGRVQDGPLLLLLDDTQEKEKYLEMFVQKQKLHVKWDLGAGETSLSHPETLQAIHDDGDQATYKIDIERIWNNVNLRVERVGTGTVVTTSNSSTPAASRLATTRLWLGGRGGGEGAGLTGCVHALYYDDATIGLWNFNQQPPEAKCTGCTQRWSAGGRGAALAWFNGAGYAELRRSGRRAPDPRHFSIAFTFRTRDQNALLFLAEDVANNRSVSVELRDCRVVFLVQYSGARLEIATSARHCGGQLAHVQATRVFAGNKLERGSLRVNGEETLGSAEPPVQRAGQLPQLAGARYWLGGRAGQPRRALLGCLGGLALDRDSYSLFDTAARHGVEHGCDNRLIRSAIFEGGGYVELPSPSIRRKSALGLTFSAREPGGLLLYRAANVTSDTDEEADDKHYLAVLLVAGELHLIAAAGKTELRLRTNDTKLDDGRLHVLRIIRAHKQLELWVDDEKLASGVLAGNALPSRSRGLLLGGRSPRVAALQEVGDKGFTGTIGDFIVDNQLIGLETAVEWDQVRLGRADGELPPPAQPSPPPPDALACGEPSSYTVEVGAVKFGDTAWSHAALRLTGGRELTVGLHYRTFRDGILLLVPGPKNKPKHYTALVIREGRLRLVLRGRKRKELSLDQVVTDGTWRQVFISIGRNRATLSVGELTARAHVAAPARARRLYVGGPAAAPAPRGLPPQISNIGGLVGCVRRVEVDGRASDLARSRVSGAGQCFPAVERAAYLAGDAYARVDNVDGESTEVRLKFRSSSPRGLLLATRAFVLELQDGKVVLTRYWSTGEVSGRAVAGRACDGGWHSVVVRAADVALDGQPPRRAAPHTLPLPGDAPTHTQPLYLAGLPEGTVEWSDGGRDNFKGCIKDVVVGGRPLELRHLHTHNVVLDSCPTPH